MGLGRRGRLVGAAAVGLLGAGAFRTDPVLGYPPGEHAERTREGRLHDLFGLPVFLGIPAAAFVEARRARGAWRVASAASGAGMLATFVVAGVGFAGRPLPGGLYQRISLAIGLGWVAAFLLRRR